MAQAALSDEICAETLALLDKHNGNISHAAIEAGISRLTFNSRVNTARKRLTGMIVTGRSTLRNADGEMVLEWEKTSLDRAAADEAYRASLLDLAKQIKGLAPSIAPPTACDDDLLAVIPMGDPHFGLLAWAKETGDDFDLIIAEQLTVDAVDRLTAIVPAAGTAMLLNLGDFWHVDDSTNRTPKSGARLDVDGRFAKIASVGFRAMIRCINRMREKHRKVIVRCNRGNHDPHQSYMLAMALEAYFHDVAGVEIDMSPSSFYYYRFGKVLIGSTHGDGAKLSDLPLLMATDVPHDWAAAEYRHWHCGHFHHDQLKESPGCTVETHRTLAGKDSWHSHEGYRSGRDMKAIIYHREHGEVTRLRCGVQTLQRTERERKT